MNAWLTMREYFCRALGREWENTNQPGCVVWELNHVVYFLKYTYNQKDTGIQYLQTLLFSKELENSCCCVLNRTEYSDERMAVLIAGNPKGKLASAIWIRCCARHKRYMAVQWQTFKPAHVGARPCKLCQPHTPSFKLVAHFHNTSSICSPVLLTLTDFLPWVKH